MAGMDELRKEHGRLALKSSYSQAINQIQVVIDELAKTREKILAEPAQASIHIAKVRPCIRENFDKANENLKQLNSALKGYEKGLAKIVKVPNDAPETNALADQNYLVNRAIVMHLLRDGEFTVAGIFFEELRGVNDTSARTGLRSPEHGTLTAPENEWERRSDALQRHFTQMYSILDELRLNHNLEPAIQWAKTHSHLLEGRGSNLEFELCQLRLVSIFLGHDDQAIMDVELDDDTNSEEGGCPKRILRAAEYARQSFAQFCHRYSMEINQLIGAMAFWQNIADSPYAHIFSNTTAWDDVSDSFTREFCSLLGMSSSSPLYVACTAGSIALPRLSKFKSLTRSKRAEWTTEGELPVEIPLPPAFHFHSVFVCPISKEQATENNPPMILPCCHVICRDSLRNVSKGARFECPYCPVESHPKEAKQVYV